uniref:Uncharacterized protein n=1 Tax=Beihai levi-like virus 11 TaxID=1922396 RepID=A0A1L3KHV1_9VIRU|nr:hypothetical protein [Beihai levi-like virus 11]
MFSDPETVTINAVGKNLIRINDSEPYASEYRLIEATGEYSMKLRNTSYVRAGTNVKVSRHNVELIHTVYGATTDDPNTIRKAYIVFENDQGDSFTDVEDLVTGLVDFLTAANITKLLNWES